MALHKSVNCYYYYYFIFCFSFFRFFYFCYFFTLGINVPKEGLKKLEKMKRLGMSKIPCGHKRAYFHVEEQR